VRHVLPDWTILDLERPGDRAVLEADLEGFLAANARHIAFDEAQRHPALFGALRHAVDAHPGRGRFVLLGSAGSALMRGVSESLAGRVGLLELAPFSAAELPAARTADRWFWGGFPPVHARRGPQARAHWLDAYVTQFLERDLPALGVRIQPQRLRTLWTMLTHVHGRTLNVSDLARSLGVSSHTVNDHLDVLEAAFMIRRLAPFHANVQKRLARSPKLYIRDTGLLHFLAGLRRPSELRTWPQRGSSFEGMVIEEIAGMARERTVRPGLFHWRTSTGTEVDLLVQDGRRLVPIEIKLGSTVDPRALAGLRQCMKDLGLKRGWVVYGGNERRELGSGVVLVPWREVVARNEDFGLGRA
jgi:predicted AAA+ superfamily ATPase